MKIDILALQGAVAAHREMIRDLGAAPIEVRTAAQLSEVDALIIPGGESTTISRLLELNEMFDPIADRLNRGMPAFGTCAGMILLASEVLDGRDDQRTFGVIEMSVRRNAFGRQVDSFETDLRVELISDPESPLHAVFIRAPFVESAAVTVDVLAAIDGHPVCARQGSVLVAAFHPELGNDPRIHEMFLAMVRRHREESQGAGSRGSVPSARNSP